MVFVRTMLTQIIKIIKKGIKTLLKKSLIYLFKFERIYLQHYLTNTHTYIHTYLRSIFTRGVYLKFSDYYLFYFHFIIIIFLTKD